MNALRVSFSQWTYTAACVYQALERCQPGEIPTNVFQEATALLGSAKKVALKAEGLTTEDTSRHAIVSHIVAANLIATCGGTHCLSLVNETIVYLDNLLRNVYAFQTDNRSLIRFFHTLCQKGEEQDYTQATTSRFAQQ